MTQTEHKPQPRGSAVDRVLTALQVNHARLEVKLDTALQFRQDIRREYEQFKLVQDREMERVQSRLDSLEERITDLRLQDTKHDGYFTSIGFVKDLFVGIALAIIATGVFW